jgi:ElaB/YqjD/DUF883 family membrane-anchored ribosome-binding protein
MADSLADSGTPLGEQVRATRDEAKWAANNARGVAGEVGSKIKNMATESAGQAKQYAQQGYKYAADKTKQAKETTEGYIQENPWYAVGIALGVGVLVGLLLRGRGGNRDD